MKHTSLKKVEQVLYDPIWLFIVLFTISALVLLFAKPKIIRKADKKKTVDIYKVVAWSLVLPLMVIVARGFN